MTFIVSASALHRLYGSLSSFKVLGKNIPKLSPIDYINNFVATRNTDSYNNMAKDLFLWLNEDKPGAIVGVSNKELFNQHGLRVQIIDADGTTIFDSSKGEKDNIFDNIGIPAKDFSTSGKYKINENQGNRGYVSGATFSSSGIFLQKKMSNTTKSMQSYICVKQGVSPNNPKIFVVVSLNGDF